MGGYATLGFYQAQFDTYQQAKAGGKVYSVRLDYAEAHEGLTQSAVWDAKEIIAAVKNCFGLEEQRLKYVLLDEKDNLIDAG
jgi:hypothetical protein